MKKFLLILLGMACCSECFGIAVANDTVPQTAPADSMVTRSDIENDFIARLQLFEGERAEFPAVDPELLEPYDETKFVLPGAQYVTPYIAQNTYFNSREADPVWDAAAPLESMANLFIFPADKYLEVPVELTVIAHEYGKKISLTVTLNRLLAMCEADGCTPFWGVEKFDDGHLEGALFLVNRREGYNHLFRISADPAEVISNGVAVTARASLFVPINNIHDLFAPYEESAGKEKIHYEK